MCGVGVCVWVSSLLVRLCAIFICRAGGSVRRGGSALDRQSASRGVVRVRWYSAVRVGSLDSLRVEYPADPVVNTVILVR